MSHRRHLGCGVRERSTIHLAMLFVAALAALAGGGWALAGSDGAHEMRCDPGESLQVELAPVAGPPPAESRVLRAACVPDPVRDRGRRWAPLARAGTRSSHSAVDPAEDIDRSR